MDYKTKIGLFSFLGCLITIGSVFAAFTMDPSSEVDIDVIDPEVDFDEVVEHKLALNAEDIYEFETRALPVTMSIAEHHQFITPIDNGYHLDTFVITSGSNEEPISIDSSLVTVFLIGPDSIKKDLVCDEDYTIVDNAVMIESTIYEFEDFNIYDNLVVEYHVIDPNLFVDFDCATFTRTQV